MNKVVFVETLRRHFTNGPYLAFVGFVSIIASISGATNSAPGMWQGFWSLLTLAIGAQLIGPEFSSGTLQLIMSRPVNRSVYLLSRVAGVVVAAWVAVAVPFVFDMGGRLLIFSGPSEWKSVSQVIGGEALHAVLTCALLAFFGSITRAYFNVAIYFALNVGLAMIVGGLRLISGGLGGALAGLRNFLLSNPWVTSSLETVHDNLFPEVPPQFDPRWAILVVSNAAVALMLACLMFRRREVPYGAD